MNSLTAVSTRQKSAPLHLESARLHARGICKRYGSATVLSGVNLTLLSGTVHALLGENGAGKSTLVKILTGAIAADGGGISLDAREVRFDSAREAIEAGIIPVHQHLSLFPHLTVRENLAALDTASGSSWLARSIPEAEAISMLRAVGLELGLEQRVCELGIAQRQLVEIARALGRRCAVLVLDEPTAALTPSESDRLFTAVRRACEHGTAVLLVSHKMDEIEEHAHEVSVLRDGAMVISAASRGAHSRLELVNAMLGTTPCEPTKRRASHGAPVLNAAGVKLHKLASDFSADVHSGEVVGVAGLLGSGALEAGAMLAGAHRPVAGSLRLNGRDISVGNRRQAIAAGLGYVPADRAADGLFGSLAAWMNGTVNATSKMACLGFTRPLAERAAFDFWARDLLVQPANPDLHAVSFSGGNQQKLLVARCMLVPGLSALVVLEPTRGVDVGARALIHRALQRAAQQGVAVVVASSDLEEVTQLCDRVLVFASYELVGEVLRPSVEDLASLMAAKVRK